MSQENLSSENLEAQNKDRKRREFGSNQSQQVKDSPNSNLIPFPHLNPLEKSPTQNSSHIIISQNENQTSFKTKASDTDRYQNDLKLIH
jgi:hypothetical protein